MSYESKIYIVDKRYDDWDEQYGKYWASMEACFNLGMNHEMPFIIEHYNPTNCFFYDDVGYLPMLEDKYGEPLIEIPIDSLIYELENLQCKSWRTSALLEALKIIADEHTIKPRSIVCLHYGY